jgi:hypothetical protein
VLGFFPCEIEQGADAPVAVADLLACMVEQSRPCAGGPWRC